ncbi:sporulation protein YqfD [Sinanaerobacter chloroacetimidivorans]|uniref:Sporulation protein YqfD n=1 Tax=Sinanaerobacter chloroacetimidivorans TaxID=2818044 RepID=A0A8J7VZQ5_9FIRM|nr:sporulation protein YqfD [Sinanaerobacter chloroacetimidivorans]MBR0596345.1 sporulation protein YqfD [Sinanaerobacter chloroacetimidivorans]
MKDRGSFLEHYIKILVEGFEQQRLLSECIKAGIVLRDIHTHSDIEMSMSIMYYDYNRFVKLAKNRYRITVLHENGYIPVLRKIISKKSTIVGLILFILLMYYQSSFVSEIRISGYETFTEAAVRDSLKEAGLYEGCSKKIDISKVKLHIYQDLDNIAWIGVKYIGNMAEVTIVEGTITPKPVDISKPCNVVAKKEGYVDRVIAKEGKIALEKGAYIKVGDVVISGIIPLKSTAYGTSASAITERYVHAAGEVYAKIPYRFTFYQEKYNLIKTPTGRSFYGIRLEVGNVKLNTAKMINNYDSSVYTETKLFGFIRPIPIYAAVTKTEEVELSREKRSTEELSKDANRLARSLMKENIPEKAQILNKSLKFSPEENIIGVAVMLETLEEIGEEKEIVIGKPTD